MNLRKTKLSKIKIKKFDSIKDVLDLGLLSSTAWLAGGALRTLIDSEDVVNDYDLFFQNAESSIEVKNKLVAAGFECIYECPNGFLFTYRKDSIKIQLICENTYKNTTELLNSFDFTVTCAATDGEYVYYSTAFIKDIKKKELHLSNLVYPVATFKRVMKYASRGYKIRGVAEEFVKQVNEKELLNEEELRAYID